MKWIFFIRETGSVEEGWIFYVENAIMVEIKALIKLEDVHLAQAMNYLEAYNVEIGTAS